MSDFLLTHCFMHLCPVLDQDGFVAGRLEHLTIQLTEQRTAILQHAVKYENLETSAVGQYHDWFQRWLVEVRLTPDTWQQYHEQLFALKDKLGAETLFKVLKAHSNALIRHLPEHSLIWCDQHSNELQQGLTAHRQQQQLLENLYIVVEQVVTELRALPSLSQEWQDASAMWGDDEDDAEAADKSDANNSVAAESVKVDPQQLQQALTTLFTEWCQYPYCSQTTLEQLFLRDFAYQVIAQFPVSQRFWKALLVKLDRQLSHALHDSLRAHVLSDTFDVLIAAVPRYPFIQSMIETLLPLYEELTAPIGDLLLVSVFRNSLPDSALAVRYMQQLDVQRLVTHLEEQLHFLAAGNQEGIHLLRPHWERAELDWLAEAMQQLEQQLQYCALTRTLMSDLGDWQNKFSSLLTEGLTNQRGTETTTHLLTELMRQAIRAATLSPRPQFARELFRRAMTLTCTPDRQWVVWKKHRQIALSLQNLERDNLNDPALWAQYEPLLSIARPLFAAFDAIVADNIEFNLLWYQSIELPETLVSAHPGCRLHDLQHSLYYLALYLRLYSPYLAVLHLKRRYAQYLTEHCEQRVISLNSRAILDTFHELQAHIQAAPNISPELLNGLQQFIHLLPTITASLQLYRQTTVLTLLANVYFLKAYPDYIKRVGERGIQLGIRDNELTLERVAQVLSSTVLNPTEYLQLWFNCFASDMANVEKRTLEANLAALNHVLQARLLTEEAEPVYALINDVYVKSLGISYNPIGGGQTRQLQFFELISTGPRWQRLFGKPANSARALSAFAEQVPLLLQQTQLPVEMTALINEQLQAFIQALKQHGDEEVAWQQVQPLFDQALQTNTTRQLEMAWRALFAVMPGRTGVFWHPLLLRGIESLRQVGLGRAVSRHARLLAQQMTRQLLIISPPPPELHTTFEIKGYRDLGKFLDQMAHALRSQCATLAALNIGRYLVECIVPFVNYPGRFWQMAWLQWVDSLLPELDDCEQLALMQWSAQLNALSADLPATKPIGEFVFHNPDFLFAETRQGEQHWRDFISSLLVAAFTDNSAPFPASALTQRLFLSSPLFREETVSSWEDRANTLAEAFNEQLPDTLAQRINQQQTILMSSLVACDRLLELRKSLQGLSAYCLMLSHLPSSRHLWYCDLALRTYTEHQDSLTPVDGLIGQLSGWPVPDLKRLKQQTATFQAVADWDFQLQVPQSSAGWLGWLRGKSRPVYHLTVIQKNALKTLLRVLALEPILAGNQRQAQLFETLLLFFSHQDEPTLIALSERMQYTLAEHAETQADLITRWQQLSAELPRIILAERLWLWHDRWSQHIVKQIQPFQQRATAQSYSFYLQCTRRDLSFLLRHLALHLVANADVTDFAHWYWERIGSFLQAETRSEALHLFPQLTEVLQAYLSPAEYDLLQHYMTGLITILNHPPQHATTPERPIHSTEAVTEPA